MLKYYSLLADDNPPKVYVAKTRQQYRLHEYLKGMY